MQVNRYILSRPSSHNASAIISLMRHCSLPLFKSRAAGALQHGAAIRHNLRRPNRGSIDSLPAELTLDFNCRPLIPLPRPCPASQTKHCYMLVRFTIGGFPAPSPGSLQHNGRNNTGKAECPIQYSHDPYQISIVKTSPPATMPFTGQDER